MTYEVDGTNPLVRQDLDDLFERWSRAVDRLDMVEARRAFEDIDAYVHAREAPSTEGMPDGLLYRIEKEDPL